MLSQQHQKMKLSSLHCRKTLLTALMRLIVVGNVESTSVHMDVWKKYAIWTLAGLRHQRSHPEASSSRVQRGRLYPASLI